MTAHQNPQKVLVDLDSSRRMRVPSGPFLVSRLAMRDEPNAELRRQNDRSSEPTKGVGWSRQQDRAEAVVVKMFAHNMYNQQVQQFQKQIDQLKREVGLQRQHVSSSSREIIAFCENEKGMDPLISKLPASTNPFRNDKGLCKIFWEKLAWCWNQDYLASFRLWLQEFFIIMREVINLFF